MSGPAGQSEAPSSLNLAEISAGQLLRRWIASAAAPFTISMVLALLTYLAAGNTFGLFAGGLALLVVLLPPLILTEDHGWERAFSAEAVFWGIALIWLVPVFSSVTTWWHWLQACIVLASLALFLAALAVFLRRIGIAKCISASLAIIAGFAWLTWPIWASPWLTGDSREQIAGWAVWIHPLFALNGVMIDVFPTPWAQLRIAYMLTSIGDDIPYAMPTSILPCFAAHALAGTLLLLLCFLPGRKHIS